VTNLDGSETGSINEVILEVFSQSRQPVINPRFRT
jgi:hypothetical protein